MAKKTIKRSKTVDKWKTKKWFTLVAPKIFNLKELGTTPTQKPKNLENRVIEKTLDQLTGNRKLKHVTIRMKVKEIQELKAYTQIVGHEIKGSYIARMVRRRKSKIDSVLTVFAKNGEKIRITATTLCNIKLKSKKETDIRKIMEEEIIKLTKEKNYENFVGDLLSGELSSNIFKRIKSIAPIKRVEIIKSRIISG